MKEIETLMKKGEKNLTAAELGRGVVTASNGNHGLGVSAAAKARGIAAEVFVSSHVSPAKARRIEAMGARIVRAGDDPLTAELAARQAAEESARVFISPYNDVDVAAGQGTIGSLFLLAVCYDQLHLCETAIYEQFDSRDVTTVVRREKHDCLCDLLGCAEPAEWNSVSNHLLTLLARFRGSQ